MLNTQTEIDVIVCGSLNLDWVTHVRQLPKVGETVLALSSQKLPGGKGLNQAIAAARMGAKVRLLGVSGADSEAHLLRASLNAEGVDTSTLLTRAEVPTGMAQVLVDQRGQNSIIVHAGANGTMTALEVIALTSRARVYIAQLETPAATVAAFFNKARQYNGICILNAAPALPETAYLFALADVIVCNETELGHYSESEELNGSLTELSIFAKLARNLIKRPNQTIVITLGARGVLIVTQLTNEYIAAVSVKAIDTTGAGDCFCGVLASELARGKMLSLAISIANHAASIAVTRVGAAPSMPKKNELI